MVFERAEGLTWPWFLCRVEFNYLCSSTTVFCRRISPEHRINTLCRSATINKHSYLSQRGFCRGVLWTTIITANQIPVIIDRHICPTRNKSCDSITEGGWHSNVLFTYKGRHHLFHYKSYHHHVRHIITKLWSVRYICPSFWLSRVTPQP